MQQYPVCSSSSSMQYTAVCSMQYAAAAACSMQYTVYSSMQYAVAYGVHFMRYCIHYASYFMFYTSLSKAIVEVVLCTCYAHSSQ